jgi:hypothetical protein
VSHPAHDDGVRKQSAIKALRCTAEKKRLSAIKALHHVVKKNPNANKLLRDVTERTRSCRPGMLH